MPEAPTITYLPLERSVRPGDLPPRTLDLPDLSVPRDYELVLQRSGWAGVIDIEFAKQAAERLDGELRDKLVFEIGSRLLYRTTVIKVSRSRLRADFQIEDGTRETRRRLRSFALALRLEVGPAISHVDVRMNDLDPADTEPILTGKRAPLRGLN